MDMLQTQQTNGWGVAPIVVAVSDPLLHPEAIHIAAACGRPILEAKDAAQLAQLAAKAFALLVDVAFTPSTPTPHTFLITASPEAAGREAFVLPAQSADLLRALGGLAMRGEPVVTDAGVTIAVVGAAGGVGVSTLAASISRRAHATRLASSGATLIDANRISGGVDLLLGIEAVPGARWGEIELGEGVVSRGDVRRALPTTNDDIAVLTFSRSTVLDPVTVGPREVDAVVAAVSSAGVTVIDAAPGMLPARCDLVCIVVPPQLRAAAGAARIATECAAAGLAHALVVRDCQWESLGAEELERAVGARTVTRLRTRSGLTRAVERQGLPERLPRELASAADAVLAEVVR